MRYASALAASCVLLGACAHEPETATADDFSYSEPAARAAAPSAPITRYADEDRDGKVTRDEAKVDPLLAETFDDYDLDKNDALDRGEFARLEADSRNRRAQTMTPSFTPPRPGAEPLPEVRPTSRGGDSLNRSGPDRAADDPGAP